MSDEVIAGNYVMTSLAEFEERCKVQIEAEQKKLSPDNTLIGLLCDAAGLSREHDPHSFYRGMIRAAQQDAHKVVEQDQRIAELENQLAEVRKQLADTEECLLASKKYLYATAGGNDELERQLAALQERSRWRPIEEMHEDHGPCVCVNLLKDAADMEIHSIGEADFDEFEWTHFARVPELSTKVAEELIAELNSRIVKPCQGK